MCEVEVMDDLLTYRYLISGFMKEYRSWNSIGCRKRKIFIVKKVTTIVSFAPFFCFSSLTPVWSIVWEMS